MVRDEAITRLLGTFSPETDFSGTCSTRPWFLPAMSRLCGQHRQTRPRWGNWNQGQQSQQFAFFVTYKWAKLECYIAHC